MKVDITLLNERGGITMAEVPWATNVPIRWAGEKVRELLERMEKNPEAFQGKIIVSVVRDPVALYHGYQHREQDL
jgi:hypothetical protein